MLFEDERLKFSLYTGVAAVICVAVSVFIIASTTTRNPTALELALFILTLGLACILAFVAASAFLAWAEAQRVELYDKQQQADAVTPLSRAAEIVRGMTAEQCAVLPNLAGGLTMAEKLTRDGTVWGLLTTGGLIPLEMCEKFLRHSGVVELMNINETSDKTPERQMLRWFTDEMILCGLALPAAGNRPAIWANDHAKVEAAKRMGIELIEAAE